MTQKMKNKFQNNWLSKSLESLEKDYWGDIPKDESYLVTTCHKLRKKQLKAFETEDLRIMIGQNIGLKYLVPLAIETLNKEILAEGDYYEGDLLKSVLSSDKEFWKNEIGHWTKVCELYQNGIKKIENEAEKYSTGREIIKAFGEFVKIN